MDPTFKTHFAAPPAPRVWAGKWRRLASHFASEARVAVPRDRAHDTSLTREKTTQEFVRRFAFLSKLQVWIVPFRFIKTLPFTLKTERPEP